MTKIFLIIVSLFMMTTACFAENKIFFEQRIGSKDLNQTGSWLILGRTGNEKLNAGCALTTTWTDGSQFWLTKDLIDDEVYAEYQNSEWSITDAPGNFSVRINFVHLDNSIRGGNFTYRLINKNTIMLRGLSKEFSINFFDAKAKELRLVMPGSIPNAIIPLKGTKDAIVALSKCIDASKKEKLGVPENRPETSL